MDQFNPSILKQLYKPAKDSHKGQNGKLMIIGGSMLFHGASLWALEVASRIVDMVFYSSVAENNDLVKKLKAEFRNGLVVPRDKIDHYMEEADCILIGPGLPRSQGEEPGDDNTKELTTRLLTIYKDKQWVIDGGSLQTIQPELIPPGAILTPHQQEFERLFEEIRDKRKEIRSKTETNSLIAYHLSLITKKYHCTILLKGQTDIVCSVEDCVEVSGGNPGMTKGGTGDVLAGLVAALACKNNPFLAAAAGSFINKKAGDELYKRVGPYFNASDLANEIPKVMKQYIV